MRNKAVHKDRVNCVIKGLKVCFLNIRGLFKHLDELRLFSDEHSPHLIYLNETKLDSDVADNELRLEGFHEIFRKDRDKNGGGVAIYVRSNIKCKIREDFDDDLESISVELDVPYVKPILVTTLYRPPDSRVELFSFIENMISKIDLEGKECILTGDFNCDLFKSRDNDTKHLKRIYGMYHFKQLIAKPTRVTSDTRTLIDHIATNRPDNVSQSDVIPCGISDHDAVYSIRGMRLPKRKGTPKVDNSSNVQKV